MKSRITSLVLVLLCVGLFLLGTEVRALEPATPVFDGQDGLQPSMKLIFCNLTDEGPIPPEVLDSRGACNWRIKESWWADHRGGVVIMRCNFQFVEDAVAFPKNELAIEIRLRFKKWDQIPILGSHSAVVSIREVLFIKNTTLVQVRCTDNLPAEEAKRHLMLIAQSVYSKI